MGLVTAEVTLGAASAPIIDSAIRVDAERPVTVTAQNGNTGRVTVSDSDGVGVTLAENDSHDFWPYLLNEVYGQRGAAGDSVLVSYYR